MEDDGVKTEAVQEGKRESEVLELVGENGAPDPAPATAEDGAGGDSD